MASLQRILGPPKAAGEGRPAGGRSALQLTGGAAAGTGGGGAIGGDAAGGRPAVGALGGALRSRRLAAAASAATAASKAVPAWLPRDKVESALSCDWALYAAAEAKATDANPLGTAAVGQPVPVPRGGVVQIIDGTETGWVEEWRNRRENEVRMGGADFASSPVAQVKQKPCRSDVCSIHDVLALTACFPPPPPRLSPQLRAYRARRAEVVSSLPALPSATALSSTGRNHPRCALLVFYHLPKAGGSFVVNTVNRMLSKDNPHGPWCAVQLYHVSSSVCSPRCRPHDTPHGVCLGQGSLHPAGFPPAANAASCPRGREVINLAEAEARGFALPTEEELESLPVEQLCAMGWAQRRVFMEVHANINFYRRGLDVWTQ